MMDFTKILEAPFPKLSAPQLDTLIRSIKDYQLTHGSIIKGVAYEEEHTVPARPIGTTVYPTPFPRSLFNWAIGIQKVWNELYAAISEDPEWLEEILRDLIENDPFTKALWMVYTTVRDEGFVQTHAVGIFRSDYMLHTPQTPATLQLKQVEFNTWSCAGGTHANIIADMHRYLSKRGAYIQEDGKDVIDVSAIPANGNVAAIASTLKAAHDAYGSCKSKEAARTGILMVVQPWNMNIADERPLEYAVWNSEPSVPLFRIQWGAEIMARTRLSGNRALLYDAYPGRPPIEVSVVYHRAGIDAEEYEKGSAGIEARIHLERSRAIKCPSVLGHLAGFKKVQQALGDLRTLERFLPKEKAEAIISTMAPMYPLDESEIGLRGRELARDPTTAKDYVMKPSLEGGGHNIYREDIPEALKALDEPTWRNYILMELIKPPATLGLLMTPLEMYEGPIVCELGIWGGCLWKTKATGLLDKLKKSKKDMINAEILLNENIGWSMRTKSEEIDEMSVVKGYGCFDTPRLI